MGKIYAAAKLVKDFRIDVDDDRKHAVCLDLQPNDRTDMGPSALELALMSYVGCYLTIFTLTARKMRITLKHMEVRTEAVKSEVVGTMTETKTDIHIKADAPEDRIQKAHELTFKSCPDGILFEKAGVKMKYAMTIEK